MCYIFFLLFLQFIERWKYTLDNYDGTASSAGLLLAPAQKIDDYALEIISLADKEKKTNYFFLLGKV